MMAVCLLFLEPLLVLFGADAETLPYASQYLTIYLLEPFLSSLRWD